MCGGSAMLRGLPVCLHPGRFEASQLPYAMVQIRGPHGNLLISHQWQTLREGRREGLPLEGLRWKERRFQATKRRDQLGAISKSPAHPYLCAGKPPTSCSAPHSWVLPAASPGTSCEVSLKQLGAWQGAEELCAKHRHGQQEEGGHRGGGGPSHLAREPNLHTHRGGRTRQREGKGVFLGWVEKGHLEGL